MKIIYLVGLSLAISGFTFGQVSKTKTSEYAKKGKALDYTMAKTDKATPSKAVVIWSDDFSVGTGWTYSNTSSPAYDWSITTNLSASPVAALNPAGFATAANGYAIIDSDSQGANGVQDAYLISTATINCSAAPAVLLKFAQTIRRFGDVTTVEVSNDGGTTWVPYPVNTNLPNSVNSPNPDNVNVNISATAAGQSNVSIRFHYEAAYGWFWAIDDVQVVEPDPFDLAAKSVYWGTEASWGSRLPYYSIPSTQIMPIQIGGIVENIGSSAQPDVTIGALSGAYAGASTPSALAAGAVDSFNVSPDFTPPATVGANAISVGLTSSATDSDPSNNTFAGVTVNVSNFTYSRDNGTRTSGFLLNNATLYEFGNIYDVANAGTCYGVLVDIHPNTDIGSEVKGVIRGFVNDDFEYLGESGTKVVTAAMLGTVINLPLISPLPVNAGESYCVNAAFVGGGGTTGLIVGTSGVAEAQTTFLFDDSDQTWYYTTSNGMVRMSFDPSLGIDELENPLALGVFPNPASDVATVTFETETSSDVVLTITDLSGKVVYSNDMNSVIGVQNIEINTASFESGVYMVNISSNGNQVTKKLAVK